MSEGSWLDEARKLAEYRKEAIPFLLRASKRFDVSPSHAKAVGRLWLEADKLDSLIYSLLEELNNGLLSGKGEIDATRGASVKPHHGADTLLYECTWSLVWEKAYGINVSLAVEPSPLSFEIRVASLKAAEDETLSFPPETNSLKNALTNSYAAEASLQEQTSQSKPRRPKTG